MLYVTRNHLAPEIYRKRWWSNKEDERRMQEGRIVSRDRTAARVEISVGFRIAMLVISLFFLFGIILDTLT